MTVSPALIDRLERKSEESKQRTEFSVLIWGPGLGDMSLPGQKRRKIKEDLEQVVGEGWALLSEDIATSQDPVFSNYTQPEA